MPVNIPSPGHDKSAASHPKRSALPATLPPEVDPAPITTTRHPGSFSPQNILRLQRTVGNQAVMRFLPGPVAAAPRNLIQRGVITVFDSNSTPKSKNVKLNPSEAAAAIFIAQEIESILEQAQHNVDEGYSTTNSAAALGRDTGSRARSAKRGTAIHAETYLIIGDQLKGYGNVETKVTNGRADIIVDLFKTGKKVIYDLTSLAQGTKAHTSGRGYDADPAVAMIIEITYDDF